MMIKVYVHCDNCGGGTEVELEPEDCVEGFEYKATCDECEAVMLYEITYEIGTHTLECVDKEKKDDQTIYSIPKRN